MQPSHGYLLIALVTVLFISYGSIPSTMWNGPDYYNPRLEGILGGPYEPGLRPAVKAYTMGGLPNDYLGVGVDGSFRGRYDYLGMNLTGRNAFPGDFDYSMFHNKDCGCGCRGRGVAKKEAVELAGKVSEFTSHMTRGFGVGNKYGDYLSKSASTVSGKSGGCQVGTTIKNPNSCAIQPGEMSYDAGGMVSSFTSGNTDVRYLQQTSTGPPPDLSLIPRSSQWAANLFGRTVNAVNTSGGAAIMSAYSLEELQSGYLASASKNSELNGSGRINPHIDSPVNNGINYGKKGKPETFRGMHILDEAKGAPLRV